MKSFRWFVIGILLVMCLVFALGKTGLLGKNGTPTGAFIGVAKGAVGAGAKAVESLTKGEKEALAVSYNSLILDIIELRKAASTDAIKKAELVTEIDDAVHKIANKAIIEEWETTALCLAKKCADDDFFNLILAVAYEGDKVGMKRGSLIANLLTANKYWNTDNTVRFSNALTAVNVEITALNNEAITAKWHEIVDCAGTCAEKDELNFEIIEMVMR